MAELSTSDVVMMTKHQDNKGMAATGIGLAAGLGGGALLLAIAAAWGVNQASKARANASEQAVAGQKSATDMLTQLVLAERTSRENWQATQTPSIKNYVDASTSSTSNPSVASTASALADALAYNSNSGLNSAIGTDNYLRVQRYSSPQPCGCDA